MVKQCISKNPFRPFLFVLPALLKRLELKNPVIFGEHPATMGASPCIRMIFPSVVFSASLPSFFFSPPFFVSFISLLSAYPVEKMCLFPRLGIFSCFPDCLHFNPVRIFSSLSPPFFLPASTLFLPRTPFFRFFPPAFPLPFPCAYI